MKQGGGKRKGGAFERDVCKKLSLFVTEGKNENIFWRSAMSGGRATLQTKKGTINKSQCGDITAISEEGFPYIERYFFECKTYKTLSLNNLIYNKNTTDSLLDFWNKNFDKANELGKELILIAKENGKPSIICIHSKRKFYSNLLDSYKDYFPNASFKKLGFCVYLLDEFLFNVDCKSLLV